LMRKIIVIPARLASSRLPNKILLDLGGKTIIQRVFEQCSLSDADEVFIATDSLKVKKACSVFTKNIILTNKNHTSGTDRIAEAVKEIDCDVVINVQGDEPFIHPELINQLLDSFEGNIQMVSAMEPFSDIKEIENPNNVKVVVDKNKNALYFSRAKIPYNREQINQNNYYKHIGIYAYTKEFLLKYSQMEISFLEQIEKLEQLRVLENGYKIKMIATHLNAIGIDTEEDYKKAIQYLKEKKGKTPNY